MAVTNATDKTYVYHGKVWKAGHIEKPIYRGKLSFTMVKKSSSVTSTSVDKVSALM